MNPSRNPALISIVLLAHDGVAELDRAIGSILAQTFADWELLVAEDGVTGEGHQTIARWAERESRIRLVTSDGNDGPGAARNAAIRIARGDFLAYLDPADEFYPGYLETLAGLRDRAEVLLFRYDFACHGGPSAGRVTEWDPAIHTNELFLGQMVRPLGVAHRRSLWERLGGFNELLWNGEDADLWKRMARSGAEFFFVPIKSGRCHVAAESPPPPRNPTPRQREAATANWQAGRPIFTPAARSGQGMATGFAKGTVPFSSNENWDSPQSAVSSGSGPVRRIAFISPHCLIDSTNGATAATLDMLCLLSNLGFQCEAFCGGRIDRPQDVPLTEILTRQGIPFKMRKAEIGSQEVALICATHKGIPVTIFPDALRSTYAGNMGPGEAFLAACRMYLARSRPDAIVSYGGDAVSRALFDLIESHDIPLVFTLHNFFYFIPDTFRTADYVVTVTDFCRQYYWDALGLACQVLPPVIDADRVLSPARNARYLTFVNPEPRKGLYVFAQIARMLARRRPEIPILVVESIDGAESLRQAGVDLESLIGGRIEAEDPGVLPIPGSGLPDGSDASASSAARAAAGPGPNITMMANTPDPRRFLGVTKILLMPSLEENFGLVAGEAMLNGIPVVASNRGGLPGTVGDAGYVLEIPPQYTFETRVIPTEEEVTPWVEAITRLWDDADDYSARSERARRNAARWLPENLAGLYRDFFSNLTTQPGPPLVPPALEQPQRSDGGGVNSVGDLPDRQSAPATVPAPTPADTAPHAFPSLLTQASSLARAVASFVGDGMRLADTEEYHARLGICETCDRRRGSRCTECGCWLPLKARGRGFSCPLGRWSFGNPR